MKKILLLTFSFLNLCAFSQKDRTFNGELLYTIERISPKDSIPGKMLIYAKDSLQRVVNFSSNLGKQEMIKHLRLNKSFLLVTTTRGDYAIKTDHQQSDSTVNYSYKRKLGKLSVGGIKAKRAELSIKGIDFSAIFIENKAENFIKISFRSQGDFDVNQFARDYFNGGGHRNAAGGKSELSLQETVQKFETLATKLNL